MLYKSDQTKFKDRSDEKTGCVWCSADFMPLVEKHRAISTRPAQSMRGGGGGRGTGRSGGDTGRGGGDTGGRGGRGGRNPKDKMAQLAAYFV